jgi:hypothetical protein
MKKAEPILSKNLTPEEIAEFEAIAAELAKKYSVPKVHLHIGINPATNERVVAYLKEPIFVQKIYILDKVASVGMFSAANNLLEAVILKEESDPKTYEDYPANDDYRLGVVGTCVEIIEVVKNSYKKK